MPMIELSYASPRADASTDARLAEAATELTSRHLKKDPAVTAIALRAVPCSQWFVAGAALDGLSAFHLTVTVTAATNLKPEMEAYLAALHARFAEILGPLSEHSYAHVHEVAAHGYGYGGLTQERRFIAARLAL